MASFSISLGGGSKSDRPSQAASTSGVKRTYAALDDADSEDEDTNAGKRQNITHFDVAAGGAVDVSKPKIVKEALVIKPQANRDWKQASLRNKRQRYGLPLEEQEKAKRNFVAPAPSTTYGLNLHTPEAENTNTEHRASQDTVQPKNMEGGSSDVTASKPRTEDDRAIAALMGLKEESSLTIPAITEDEALERDVKEAPDAPTLAEYAAIPVEDFGAAMLRGMGWKEGQGLGSQKGQKAVKSKVPERRPALLGIGAKPDAAVAAELGAWGAGAKGRKRVEIVYNPLVLKNSKTGEQLTEEELKAKLQEQKEREAEERYAREPDRDYKREDRSTRHHRRDAFDSEHREERRRRERRREKDYEDDRRHSKPERRRDRSPYEKIRDYDDRREKDRRRDRDDSDRRGSRRDHHHYEDDRDRRHRR